MENAPKKGMSKGCMVALIIAAIILVLVIIGFVTCWIYKDDLAKMGASTLVNGLKTELATHEYENVDTAQFNAMADAYLAKLEAEDPLDLESYSVFMGTLQAVMDDNTFAADEVPVVMDAFVLQYPELEEYREAPEAEEPEMEEDSLATE